MPAPARYRPVRQDQRHGLHLSASSVSECDGATKSHDIDSSLPLATILARLNSVREPIRQIRRAAHAPSASASLLDRIALQHDFSWRRDGRRFGTVVIYVYPFTAADAARVPGASTAGVCYFGFRGPSGANLNCQKRRAPPASPPCHFLRERRFCSRPIPKRVALRSEETGILPGCGAPPPSNRRSAPRRR